MNAKLLALAFVVVVPASLPAASSIGLNFLRGAGADAVNVQDGLVNSLLTTDSAGAPPYAQVNWNNLGANGTNITLIDSSGALSGVVVNWASANAWSQSGGGAPLVQGSPDANMMNCYLDSNNGGNVALNANLWANGNANKPLVYFSGLSAWLASQNSAAYDVVIYADGDDTGGARVGEYWLIEASGLPTAMTFGADLSSHVWICDRTNFSVALAYGQVPSIIQSGISARWGNFAGNYTVFESQTNDSFMIRDAEFATRCVINAIQIIPRATAGGATIAPLPPSPTVYAGGREVLRAQVAGRVPFSYQWQHAGTNLIDGGNISGANTLNLTLASVGAPDTGPYTLVVSNANGFATSSVASLSIAAPVANSYAQHVAANSPFAYWRFNETSDPTTNYAVAYDYIGGLNGTYGSAALNGFNFIGGPVPADFPGFEGGNFGFQSTTNGRPSWVSAPPLNLNTNTATFCAWIYPYTGQNGFTGLIVTRNGGDVAGLGFGGNNNYLGYTWNSNNAATYNFVSFLAPPANAWSFVALTVSPSNAVLYLYNTNGQFSATNTLVHTNQAFSGNTYIGCDAPNSAGNPQGRSFNGIIDEVTVFNRTLSFTEINNLYKKALSVTAIPPVIPGQPTPKVLYAGRPTSFRILASGEAPLSYQWRSNSVSISNGGTIAGATTPTLNISSVALNYSANYDCVVQNIAGSLTSSVAALTVVASNSFPTPYESKLRELNPLTYWRLNEANGSPASYDYWGGIIASNDTVTLGAAGPQAPSFSGIETTNTAGSYDGAVSATVTTESIMNDRAQFSIIGWFNAAGPVAQRIGLFGQNDVCEFGFHGLGPDGLAQVGIWTPRAAAFMNQTNITPGVWYLVAAIGDGTNVSLTLVATNGLGGFQVLQSTAVGVTTNYGNSPYPFRIGGAGILDAAGNYFTGQLDEVAIFSRGLSAAELASLFGAALTGGDLPPGISTQPTSKAIYAGRTATFHVSAVGTAPAYRWRTNSVPLVNGGNLSGVTTDTLTISNVTTANIGAYECLITNRVGSITSDVATLTVVLPHPGYETALLSYNPVAYWRLNELDDPSSGTAPVFDFSGGFAGTWGTAAQNGFNSIAGPLPGDGFVTFESANTAGLFVNNTANSYLDTTPLGITAETATITAWINPNTNIGLTGIAFQRGTATGLNLFNNGNLGYHWNDVAATYNFDSGLTPPVGAWSFVAVAVETNQATLYLVSSNGFQKAVNVTPHAPRAFTAGIRIGGDPFGDGRIFDGRIDEVAFFNRPLTQADIYYLSQGTPNIGLMIDRIDPNVRISWLTGTLLEAPSVTGPWTTNVATSPYVIPASAAQKFYRVQVR